MAIESVLGKWEGQGRGALQVTRRGASVQLSFTNLQAEAVSYDIALIRLAMAMMDDPRYGGDLMTALRLPLRARQC